jgi:hypothetical protein
VFDAWPQISLVHARTVRELSESSPLSTFFFGFRFSRECARVKRYSDIPTLRFSKVVRSKASLITPFFPLPLNIPIFCQTALVRR